MSPQEEIVHRIITEFKAIPTKPITSASTLEDLQINSRDKIFAK